MGQAGRDRAAAAEPLVQVASGDIGGAAVGWPLASRGLEHGYRGGVDRVQRPIKNETPKTARGDREPEWAFLAQIPHTETKPEPRNAALPRQLSDIHM